MMQERWVPVGRIHGPEYEQFGVVHVDGIAHACLNYGAAAAGCDSLPSYLFTVGLATDARQLDSAGRVCLQYWDDGRVTIDDALVYPTRSYLRADGELCQLVIGGMPGEEWIGRTEARRLEPCGLVGMRELKMRLRAWRRGEYHKLLGVLYDIGTSKEEAPELLRRFLLE